MMMVIRNFFISTSICFILINVVGGNPARNSTKNEPETPEAERSNLSQAVQLVINATGADGTSTEKGSTTDRWAAKGSTTERWATKGSTTSRSQTPKSTLHEGFSSSSSQPVERTSSESSILTSTSIPAAAAAPEPSTVTENSPTNPTQVSQLPSDANLFNGLAQNVGTLNIGGIIMEAFKLAQVSIALFGQSLQSQFGQNGGFIIPITNSTRIIGKVV